MTPNLMTELAIFMSQSKVYDSAHDVQQQCLVPLDCSDRVQVYDPGDIWICTYGFCCCSVVYFSSGAGLIVVVCWRYFIGLH